MQQSERLTALLDKYTANTITKEEHAELFCMISTGDHDDLLEEHFRLQFYRKELLGVDMPAAKAHELMQKIFSAEQQNARLLPQSNLVKPVLRWSIAAAFIGLILVSLFFMSRPGSPLSSPSISAKFASGMLEEANHSSHPLQLRLEDSSVVTLQPGTVLHYPVRFEAAKREVLLEGEAFFSVTKHPERPFFVYCNSLVTHVLGTSFNIRIDRGKKLVEVSVRTGRVQVYQNQEADLNRKKINGVILTPNQKAIYHEEEKQFTATIVNNPLPLVREALQEPDAASSFIYEDTPLRTVIGSLEKSYGIEMIVENETMYNCLFTGDISKQNLYTKLDILCQSVNASYQIAGTRIVIEGKGCN